MLRSLKVLLLLLLTAALLCGCSAAPKEQEILCNELTLMLPPGFVDFSEDGAEEGLAFNYADVDMGICGSFEEKAYLAQYIPDIDPEKYAQLFLQTNGMDAAVETKDGIPCFTYTAADYTYLCGVFESNENFWVIQAYCASGDYAAKADAMWNCITSVTVNE